MQSITKNNNLKERILNKVRIFIFFLCGALSAFIFIIGTEIVMNYIDYYNYEHRNPTPDIRVKIYEHGDVKSYKFLVDSCRSDKQNFSHYLFYSFIMANKYNYVPANYDVYKALVSAYSPRNGIGRIDEKTKSIALFYLMRGAYKGHRPAIDELRRLGLDVPSSEPSIEPVLKKIEKI